MESDYRPAIHLLCMRRGMCITGGMVDLAFFLFA